MLGIDTSVKIVKQTKFQSVPPGWIGFCVLFKHLLHKQINAVQMYFDVRYMYIYLFLNRRGGVELERSPRVREIGVRSPIATDPSRKNR